MLQVEAKECNCWTRANNEHEGYKGRSPEGDAYNRCSPIAGLLDPIPKINFQFEVNIAKKMLEEY